MKTLVSFLLVAGLAVSASAALQTDIEYGKASGESLRLDAYVPEGAGPFPAVILVHGGGWTGGDKSGGPQGKGYIAPMHDPLTRAGFAWFSVNYRLAPKHPYPANLEDVEAAVRWVYAHAKEYHLDPKRIALAGESAGGHLVALAATRMTSATPHAAVVAFYTRAELSGVRMQDGEALPDKVSALIGRKVADESARKILREASPIFHVKAGLPPFLLVHGTADPTVPFEQATMLQQRLHELGVPCDLVTVKDGVHGMQTWDANGQVAYKEQVVAWLKKTLTVSPTATARR